MHYLELSALPAWQQHDPKAAKPRTPTGPANWSGTQPPPALGATIRTIDGVEAVVDGYCIAGGYLGAMATYATDGVQLRACVFGAEIA